MEPADLVFHIEGCGFRSNVNFADFNNQFSEKILLFLFSCFNTLFSENVLILGVLIFIIMNKFNSLFSECFHQILSFQKLF